MIPDITAVRALSSKPFKSRWKPVDLSCALAGQKKRKKVRTKLVRAPESAAVCVAEAVSHGFLRRLGLEVAECHAVIVAEKFASELSKQYGFDPPVRAGRHWGTTFIGTGSIEIEFDESNVPGLHTPLDVFRIYLADIVLGNPDRDTQGNVLLTSSGDSLTQGIIPIDQSDSFNHPSCLMDANALRNEADKPIAKWLPGIGAVMLAQSAGVAEQEMDRLIALETTLCESTEECPQEWLIGSGVDPAVIQAFMRGRIRNLKALANVEYWNGLHEATGGGHVIGS